MSFKSHFDMLSLNEPVTHKAKFWQSYVRALKGTEDMRADEGRGKLMRPRALSEFPDFFGGNGTAADPNLRIHAPGYRYMPVSRETYGYSPRPAVYQWANPGAVKKPDIDEPWKEDGIGKSPIEDEFPYLYPATMRARSLEPDILRNPRSMSPALVPRGRSPSPSFFRRRRSLSPAPAMTRARSSVPVNVSAPRPYSSILDRPAALDALLNPKPTMPISAFARDPWWYSGPYYPYSTYTPYRPYHYNPYTSYYYPYPRSYYPSYLRTGYLSPNVRVGAYMWSSGRNPYSRI